MTSIRTRVANIGESGAARRRTGGFIWAGVAVVALIAMIAVHAPRWGTLLLVLPIAFSSAGFLQAREKT